MSLVDLSYIRQNDALTKLGLKTTHHDNTISAEQGVDESFSEEHAVCHVSYTCSFSATDVFKPDSVANLWKMLQAILCEEEHEFNHLISEDCANL